MSTPAANSIAAGLRITGLSVGINLLLATGKIVAGVSASQLKRDERKVVRVSGKGK